MMVKLDDMANAGSSIYPPRHPSPSSMSAPRCPPSRRTRSASPSGPWKRSYSMINIVMNYEPDAWIFRIESWQLTVKSALKRVSFSLYCASSLPLLA